MPRQDTRQVTLKRPALDKFCAQWPCHGIPTTLASISFWFADNGDLVDILAKSRNGRRVDSATFDGPALVALSQDAQEYLGPAYPSCPWPMEMGDEGPIVNM